MFLMFSALMAGRVAVAQTEYADQPLGYHLGRHIALQGTHIPVSLDVAGPRSASRWAAVWDQNTANVEWDSIYGADSIQFLQWSIAMQFGGFRISWLTASGSGADVVYGAIARKDGKLRVVRRDLNLASLDAELADLNQEGYRPICMSAYGDAASPRFALVFEDNPDNVRWGYVDGETSSEYELQAEALTNKCWSRLSFLTRSPWGRFYAFFEDDDAGQWLAKHDLDVAEYSSFVSQAHGQGLRRARIDMTGTGANARFSVICNDRNPEPLQFTATGTMIPALQPVDEVMTDGDGGWMRDYNIRQASVAIVRKGRLVFARAYTLGTSAQPLTVPQTRFRMASLTKTINSFGLFRMLESRTDLNLDTKIADLVAPSSPSFLFVDERAKNITLRHLLNHTSGYDDFWGAAADRMTNANLSLRQRSLTSNPGASVKYSNGAYQLLSAGLQAATATDYRQYIESQLLAPAGVSGTHWMQQQPALGDARFQESHWNDAQRRTENNPLSRRLRVRRSQHANNDYINEAHHLGSMELDAAGGLVMSSIEYARVVAAAMDDSIQGGLLSTASKAALRQEALMERGAGFESVRDLVINGQTVFANGAPIRDYNKGGEWHSTKTTLRQLSSDVTLVLCTTGPEPLPSTAMIERFVFLPESAWSTTDLFPTFGYASFPRASGVTANAFGAGCDGAPDLELHSVSPQGDQVTMRASNAGLGSVGVGIIGGSSSSASGQPLPTSLAPLGAPGCLLLVSADLTTMLIGSLSGDMSLTMSLPAAPGLLNYNLYTQFAIFDPAANAFGWKFTNGLDVAVVR